MFRPRRAIFACVLLGIPLGLGAATFRYGEGLSYFSKDPQACTNCHIMRDEYDSWVKSGHHHTAVCVDCHLPHEMIPKVIAKARNGWNHSEKFTLQNFHEPIMITPPNAEILQENCLRCHENFVHEIAVSQSSEEKPGETVSCVHCHKGVGHAPLRPTGRMSWIGDPHD
jgi:cytochrome c nitrite reductase small subunit